MASVAVVLLLAGACWASPAPLAAWSSIPNAFDSKHSWAPEVQLADVLLQQFSPIFETPGVLAVFYQDGLVVEDFSKYGDAYEPSSNGGAFANLKTFLQSPSSLVVPNVVSPTVAHSAETIMYFENVVKRRGGSVATLGLGATVDVSIFNPNTVNLVIVHLGETTEGHRSELIASNDAGMKAILDQLAGSSAVSGVLLGSAAPSVEQAPVAQTKSRRNSPNPTPGSPSFPKPLALNGSLQYLYFTPPIFMGVLAGLFIVFMAFMGVFQLMIVQNPDRLPSTSDKCLTVPAN